MNSQGKKIVAAGLAIGLAVYVGDAVYPEWKGVCSSQPLSSGISNPAADIPEIESEGRMWSAPSQPPGCKVTPKNGLRMVYHHFYPIPEGYPKGTL